MNTIRSWGSEELRSIMPKTIYTGVIGTSFPWTVALLIPNLPFNPLMPNPPSIRHSLDRVPYCCTYCAVLLGRDSIATPRSVWFSASLGRLCFRSNCAPVNCPVSSEDYLGGRTSASMRFRKNGGYGKSTIDLRARVA